MNQKINCIPSENEEVWEKSNFLQFAGENLDVKKTTDRSEKSFSISGSGMINDWYFDR